MPELGQNGSALLDGRWSNAKVNVAATASSPQFVHFGGLDAVKSLIRIQNVSSPLALESVSMLRGEGRPVHATGFVTLRYVTGKTSLKVEIGTRIR